MSGAPPVVGSPPVGAGLVGVGFGLGVVTVTGVNSTVAVLALSVPSTEKEIVTVPEAFDAVSVAV